MNNDTDAGLAFEPRVSVCPICNGNDADASCAYPGAGMNECLRDQRLRACGSHIPEWLVFGGFQYLHFGHLDRKARAYREGPGMAWSHQDGTL